jgi:hypothetical protein
MSAEKRIQPPPSPTPTPHTAGLAPCVWVPLLIATVGVLLVVFSRL